MIDHVSFTSVYGASCDLVRHHFDDAAGHASVDRLCHFRGQSAIEVYGPFLGFATATASSRDPVVAARAAVASGRHVALSVAVHRNMPGLADNGPVDVAELKADIGGPSYWFAASASRESLLGSDVPVLLRGEIGVAVIAIHSSSLRAALRAAAQARRHQPLGGALRDLVAEGRDRLLAQRYSAADLAIVSRRQSLLSEATSTFNARQLAARGAPSLVPLRVTRADLHNDAPGPVAKVVADHAWTVRQPIARGADGRMTFADGREGVDALQQSFGAQPTRLLCFDATRLEFDSVKAVESGAGTPAGAPAQDAFRRALDVSGSREAALVAGRATVRRGGNEAAYGVRARDAA